MRASASNTLDKIGAADVDLRQPAQEPLVPPTERLVLRMSG
jgi:hypothetical protein